MGRRIVVFFAMVSVAWLSSVASADWVRFRGPNGTGVSESAVPTKFGLDQNLKWKLELPGKGVSSPIVVGDKVFVTCYSGYGITRGEGSIDDLKRHLLCIDRKSGQTAWQRTVDSVPEEDPYSGAGVPAHGYASHTPVSDGERVYVFYGKSGVVAYDLSGEKLWQKSVGTDSGRRQWGSAASPIIHGDLVIVNASDESETLFAFDKISGEEKWKSKADGYASTWGTPALAPGKEGTDVVLAVPGEIWAINADTGKLSWYAPGNDGASHSVVISDQVVYSIGGGRNGSSGVAVKTGGKGDTGDPLWKNNASGRFASPVVVDGRIYGVSKGIVSCFNAEDGKKVFQERLPATKSSAAQADRDPSESGRPDGREGGGRRGGRGGGGRGGQDYSSPIVAGGNIYYTSRSGSVYVFAAKAEFELIAQNDLSSDKSGFQATPAADGGQLFVRSHSNLYCFEE